jgi:MOSC domain-containing protein YiiM
MRLGTLTAIYTAPAASAPMVARPEVRAHAGRGLDGDRYLKAEGTFPAEKDRSHEVTLIESEALEALARDAKIRLAPGASRRNLVTKDVALNHLVGRRFRVGSVVLEGVKLCEPCSHLEKMTQPGVKEGLLHRAGLSARILSDGLLVVGDAVLADAPAEGAR